MEELGIIFKYKIMRNIIILSMMLFAFGISAQQIEEKSKKKKITLAVNGNCEMCKSRIEKACLKTSGVKYAYWDVSSKRLNLIYNEHKTSVDKIQQSIINVGHDVDSLKSSDEVYQQLHSCCQYRD
jgi:periplasmic mercuric ion binding protein